MAVVSKKGVFFTFSALLLLSVVFAGLIFQTTYKPTDPDKTVSVRTSRLNSFVLGFEQDMHRGLRISGFRAFLAADETISRTNNFLSDSRSNLREAIMNGTVNGTQATIMNQSTIPEWFSRIQTQAGKVGIILNISFSPIQVEQTSAFAVTYYSNVSYNVTDVTATATFIRIKELSEEIEILGFKDPIYTIYTNGQVIRAINATSYDNNYANGLDTTNLIAHIEGHFYSNSSGPSYLNRLEGNLTPSKNGIESFVSLPDLQAQGIPVFERSAIDYLYFNQSANTIYIINNTFEGWLRLDALHLEKYNVSSIAIIP